MIHYKLKSGRFRSGLRSPGWASRVLHVRGIEFRRILLLSTVACLGGTTASSSGRDGGGGFFYGTGSMSTARDGHTATPLSDGKVLITGGYEYCRTSCVFLNSAELYNPETGSFSRTGNMTTARSGHKATLLSDGKVLVVGGVGATGLLASAELYDPKSGTFSTTDSMTIKRGFSPTATLLLNGKVLIAGGIDSCDRGCHGVASAELYDPKTGSFIATGSMSSPRERHTATLLSDGNVLVAGGFRVSATELYDPETGSFTATGSMSTERGAHTATLLSDGKVLIAGGLSPFFVFASAELYDPATGTFQTTGRMHNGRAGHTATRLTNDKVLIAGGASDDPYDDAELFEEL